MSPMSGQSRGIAVRVTGALLALRALQLDALDASFAPAALRATLRDEISRFGA